MTGTAKNIVTKLAVEIGQACAKYQDTVFHDLPCKKIQCDELVSTPAGSDDIRVLKYQG